VAESGGRVSQCRAWRRQRRRPASMVSEEIDIESGDEETTGRGL
jgi:hypothetical protein